MFCYILHHLRPGAEAAPYVNSLTKILLKLVKIPNEFSGKNSDIKISLKVYKIKWRDIFSDLTMTVSVLSV